MSSDTMRRVYLDAQNACGLEVGNRVKVMRRAKTCEGGWTGGWTGSMNDLVGVVGKIVAVGSDGVHIEFQEPHIARWFFPYFVLEKVDLPAKPVHEFKPFDRVLVRDMECDTWHVDIFSSYDGNPNANYPYITIAGYYMQCVPYEGNEHLLGTANKPEGINGTHK